MKITCILIVIFIFMVTTARTLQFIFLVEFYCISFALSLSLPLSLFFHCFSSSLIHLFFFVFALKICCLFVCLLAGIVHDFNELPQTQTCTPSHTHTQFTENFRRRELFFILLFHSSSFVCLFFFSTFVFCSLLIFLFFGLFIKCSLLVKTP